MLSGISSRILSATTSNSSGISSEISWFSEQSCFHPNS